MVWKNIICAILLGILLLSTYSAAQENKAGALQSKDIVIGKSITFHSEIYNKDIKISISLPVRYTESNERYSVFYTIMRPFHLTSGIIKSLGHVMSLIYVNVDTYNSGDFLPSKIESRPNSGNADRFLAFFKKELIPFIDSHYRTQPFKIIHSNSWGGLFCLYALLSQPDIFNAYIASTPWFIYDGDKKFMLKNSENYLKKQSYDKNFLFLTLGNDPDPGLKESFDSFVEILQNNPKKGLKIQSHYWEDEDHYSAPVKATIHGLSWIFKDRNTIPENVLEEGIDAIREYGKNLSLNYGFEIGLNQRPISGFGYRLLEQDKFRKAVEIFKFIIELNPEKPFNYSRLAAVYERNNQFELAKKNFELAYKIAKEQSAQDLGMYEDHIERINKKIEKKQNPAPVEVTYIANEGFLISSGTKKVLIDALFDDKTINYAHVPPEYTLNKMETAETPFDKIDLLLISHAHRDHFSAGPVLRHLENNPHGILISTKATIDKLKENSARFKKIKDQVKEATPELFSKATFTINDIEVQVLRMKHSPYYYEDSETGKRIDRHENVQNLGFLFTINGKKIFHCGDARSQFKEEYKTFRLDKENIDIAFLDRGFLRSSQSPGIEIISELIKPKHIILMHLNPQSLEHVEKTVKELHDVFPRITFFREQMEKKVFK